MTDPGAVSSLEKKQQWPGLCNSLYPIPSNVYTCSVVIVVHWELGVDAQCVIESVTSFIMKVVNDIHTLVIHTVVFLCSDKFF